MSLSSIDLNCDLGEVVGDLGRRTDTQLLKYVSSANIACGAHAGDAQSMRQTVAAARDSGVAIGAHPGFADREGMGRRSISISPGQITELVRQQIDLLSAIALGEGARVGHVKPHGAMYWQAADSIEIATAVCQGIDAENRALRLFGLSGGQLLTVGASLGLPTTSEVFADRNYLASGRLVPRDSTNAFLLDPEVAARRVLQMIQQGTVIAECGAVVSVVAQTVCIHGDHPRAVEFAQVLREYLHVAGIQVAAIGS